jgi:hypothetical protein
MWDYAKLIVLAAVALLAAIAANYAHDLPYMVNAVEVAIAAAITFIYVLRHVGEETPKTPNEYQDGVIRAGVIATAFWGIVGFCLLCAVVWLRKRIRRVVSSCFVQWCSISFSAVTFTKPNRRAGDQCMLVEIAACVTGTAKIIFSGSAFGALSNLRFLRWLFVRHGCLRTEVPYGQSSRSPLENIEAALRRNIKNTHATASPTRSGIARSQ